MNIPLFQLCPDPIEIAPLRSKLLGRHAGALVTFEGWVRNHNDGQPVEQLEYSSYAELADKEGERIVAEALTRFGVDAIVARHRIGLLAIGDIAVWVGASAAHRGPAFDACRYVIEEIKCRVPIWKKEYYSGGATGWVNCHNAS